MIVVMEKGATGPQIQHMIQRVEALGLKGKRIGDAEISPVHANFIVNMGRATAADVETLVAFIQERVHQTYGIALELEVRVVGEEG